MGKSSGNYDDINGGIDIVVADAGIGIDIEDEIAFYGFVLCVVRTVKPPTSTFDPIEILICISARSKKNNVAPIEMSVMQIPSEPRLRSGVGVAGGG